MDPITVLPDFALPSATPLADAFRARGRHSCHAACDWVKRLPYGPNTRIDDPMVLFTEGRGNCFTKHGAIARLAADCGVPVHKNLGFYRLDNSVITGASDVLQPFGLTFVPSVYCFLEYESFRVDLTAGNATGKNKDIEEFDFVARVGPESTREELQQRFSGVLAGYGAIEPRLASYDMATLGELVRRCYALAAKRCSAEPELASFVTSQ
jgi:hypothetical protein